MLYQDQQQIWDHLKIKHCMLVLVECFQEIKRQIQVYIIGIQFILIIVMELVKLIFIIIGHQGYAKDPLIVGGK